MTKAAKKLIILITPFVIITGLSGHNEFYWVENGNEVLLIATAEEIASWTVPVASWEDFYFYYTPIPLQANSGMLQLDDISGSDIEGAVQAGVDAWNSVPYDVTILERVSFNGCMVASTTNAANFNNPYVAGGIAPHAYELNAYNDFVFVTSCTSCETSGSSSGILINDTSQFYSEFEWVWYDLPAGDGPGNWPDQLDLQSVLIHELGHLIGLNHCSVSTAIMYESMGLVKRTISNEDRTGLGNLYEIPVNSASAGKE